MAHYPRSFSLQDETARRLPCQIVSYLGKPFAFPEESEVGGAIARGWEWDNVLQSIVSVMLPDPATRVVEVGSNIGASILEILAVRPDAVATCFEPCSKYRAFLEQNLALAGFTEVAVLPYLVGRQAGNGAIYTDGTSGSMRHMPHLVEKQDAAIVTLDQVFAQRRDSIQFLKTDTDGNDFEVLRGGSAILQTDRPVLFMEICPSLMTTNAEQDLRWLQSIGYGDFMCLNHLGFLIGETRSCAQVVEWAALHGYCDVLAAAHGSAANDARRNLTIRELPR